MAVALGVGVAAGLIVEVAVALGVGTGLIVGAGTLELTGTDIS